MKFYIIIIASLLGINIMTFGSTTIRTTANFGRKSNGCSGLGVCTARTTTNEAGDKTATLTLSDDGTTLIMSISQSSLEEKEGQITAGKFIQEEDYTFPREVCTALGAAGYITIPAGRYTARLSGAAYSIQFAVTDVPSGTH